MFLFGSLFPLSFFLRRSYGANWFNLAIYLHSFLGFLISWFFDFFLYNIKYLHTSVMVTEISCGKGENMMWLRQQTTNIVGRLFLML